MPNTHATALFVFSLQRQDSLAAGKNFMSLFNPATSGKVVTVGAFFVSYMATTASPAYPLRGYRTASEPTGGTLHTTDQICYFDSRRYDPAVVIRSGNPTVTLGAPLFSSPPGIVKDTVSDVHQVDAPFGFNPFLLYPGEGVVLRQDVGAAGHLWNLSVTWRELKG